MAVSAAQRAAQRKLAKQIHEETYKPSNIGKKARAAATKRVLEVRDAAFYNIDSRLRDYVKYKRETVTANVYGGETSESGPVPGMTIDQALWTADADTEELRSRAEPQYRGNPWYYH